MPCNAAVCFHGEMLLWPISATPFTFPLFFTFSRILLCCLPELRAETFNPLLWAAAGVVAVLGCLLHPDEVRQGRQA